MHFELDPNNKRLNVVHKADVVCFDIGDALGRLAGAKNPKVYDYVNAYTATLPETKQVMLFELMKKAHLCLSETNLFSVHHQQLTNIATQIYEIIDYDLLLGWVEYDGVVPFPTTIPKEYSEKDKDRNMTYLNHEYAGLAVLSIALRFMFPIWGGYIELYKGDLGTIRKEYIAFRLLDHSWIVNCEPYHRLIRYVEAWIRRHNKESVGVLGGISSMDFSNYLQSGLMIRHIASCDMDKSIDRSGLVSGIYGALNTKFNDINRKFATIRDKIYSSADSSGGSEESNFSNMEQYKVVQPLSFGEIAICRHFCNDTEQLLHQVDPTAPQELLHACLANISANYNFRIQHHAVLLTQWVLQSKIPSRLVYYLNKPELLKIIAVAQTLLWHWGYPDLAVIITARCATETLVSTTHMTEVKRRVTNGAMETLDKLYPYKRGSSGKSRNNNPAHKAIDDLNNGLSNCWLEYHSPSFMNDYIRTVTNDLRGGLPPDDFIGQLATMIVKVNELREVNNPTL